MLTIPRGNTVDDLAAQLEQAGLLMITTDDDGTVTYPLTEEGQRVAQGLAMGGGEDALEELLAASGKVAQP